MVAIASTETAGESSSVKDGTSARGGESYAVVVIGTDALEGEHGSSSSSFFSWSWGWSWLSIVASSQSPARGGGPVSHDGLGEGGRAKSPSGTETVAMGGVDL